MNENYNGWSNRETWCFSLWLNNDEALYYIKENTKEKIKRLIKSGTLKKEEDIINRVEKELKEIYEEMLELAKKGNKRIINILLDIGSWRRINYREIAQAEAEDIIYELKESNKK